MTYALTHPRANCSALAVMDENGTHIFPIVCKTDDRSLVLEGEGSYSENRWLVKCALDPEQGRMVQMPDLGWAGEREREKGPRHLHVAKHVSRSNEVEKYCSSGDPNQENET